MALHDRVLVQLLFTNGCRFFINRVVSLKRRTYDECIDVPLPIISLPIRYRFRAFQATLSLLSFGTVALPAFTLYPGVRITLPISM